MENKVKDWVKKEYDFLRRNKGIPVQPVIHRCYGVIMFAINDLFEDYNENLGNWWDDEMLPKFRELERR